jgi:hypothetical protein
MNQKRHPGSSADCPRPVKSRRNPFTRCPEFESRCPGFKSPCPESKTFHPVLDNACPDYLDGCPDFFQSCPEFAGRCPVYFRVCPDFLTLAPVLKGVAPIFLSPTRISKALKTGNLARFQPSKAEKLPKDGGLPSPADSSGEAGKRALDLAFEITRQIQQIK